MLHKLLYALCFICLPIILLGHGSHGSGVMAGFTHPIFGIDHFVAILATGTLGYVLNPSKWYLPLIAFITLMILGGLAGIDNEATFLIEKIIAFSVFALGLLIAFDLKPNLIISIIIISIFGGFHGFAHGAEMPESNTALKYISGYSLGTLLVGTIGMFLGKILNSTINKEKYITIVGGIIMGCGVMMLLA